MKKTLINIVAYSVLGLSLATVSCGSDNKKAETKTENVAAEMVDFTMAIDGMTCAKGCALPIEKMLNETEGISDAKVDFEKKAATLKYDKNKLSPEKITALFADFKSGAYTAAASTPDAIEKRAKMLAAEAEKTAEKATKSVKKAVKNVEEKAGGVKKAIETKVEGAKETGVKTIENVKRKGSEATREVKNKVNKTATSVNNTVKETKVKAVETTTKIKSDVKKININRK
jgi:copper chaperone CopZ